MSKQLLLVVLVLALAWLVALTPASALAARVKAQRAHRVVKPHRFGTVHRHVTTHDALRRKAFGDRVARYARGLLGVPYSYGGSSPRTGFDCSGFVRFVYRRFGVELPHSSYADFGLGRGVSRGSLKPGDLVFFHGLGHVGLYVGAGRFIHAPHSGTTVKVDSMSGWYSDRYDGARRLAVPASLRVTKLRHRAKPKPRSLTPFARWLLRPF